MIPIILVVMVILLLSLFSNGINNENFEPYIGNYPQSVPSKFGKAFYQPKNLDYQYYSYNDRLYAPMYRWSKHAHQDTRSNWYDDGMGKPLVLKLHYGFTHF